LHETIRTTINDGYPVLVEVESTAYFKLIKMAFPAVGTENDTLGGHVVTVSGYNTDKGTLTIVEAMLRAPIELDAAAFLACCNVHGGDIPPENEWCVFYPPGKFPTTSEMVYAGLELSLTRMQTPLVLNDDISFGVTALDRFASGFLDELQGTGPAKTKQSLFMILNFGEMMGPRSGFLRANFVAFLDEAAPFLPEKQRKAAAKAYQRSQQAWLPFLNQTFLTMKQGGHFLDNAKRRANQGILDAVRTAEHEATGQLGALVEAIA